MKLNCPRCKGKGGRHLVVGPHINEFGAVPGGRVWYDCKTCGGTGYIKAKNLRKKSDIKIGTRVTCRAPVMPYGQNMHKLPHLFFQPGDVGVVASIDTPCTTYAYRDQGGTASFLCVDYKKSNRTLRCGLYYNNVRIICDEDQNEESKSKRKNKSKGQS